MGMSAYREANRAGEAPFDKERFESELLALKEALEAFDAGTINKTVESLRSLAPEENRGIIENIFQNILVSEYDDAGELIQTLLEK